MNSKSMNSKVDDYLVEGCGRCELGGTPQCKVNSWRPELKKLRKLVLSCGLTEELKWGVPCYTYQQHNVLIVAAFKEYCSVSFFKGVLLPDPHALLQTPGENSQASRLLRFTSSKQITELESELKGFIQAAIEVERTGKKVEFKAKDQLVIPEELQIKFEQLPALERAFRALTPGRQRGYILHFTAAKQSKTRFARIEKWIPHILSGKGWNE